MSLLAETSQCQGSTICFLLQAQTIADKLTVNLALHLLKIRGRSLIVYNSCRI